MSTYFPLDAFSTNCARALHGRDLLPDELFVGLGHGVVGRVAFDSHFQVVLVAEFRNRLMQEW